MEYLKRAFLKIQMWVDCDPIIIFNLVPTKNLSFVEFWIFWSVSCHSVVLKCQHILVSTAVEWIFVFTLFPQKTLLMFNMPHSLMCNSYNPLNHWSTDLEDLEIIIRRYKICRTNLCLPGCSWYRCQAQEHQQKIILYVHVKCQPAQGKSVQTKKQIVFFLPV